MPPKAHATQQAQSLGYSPAGLAESQLVEAAHAKRQQSLASHAASAATSADSQLIKTQQSSGTTAFADSLLSKVRQSLDRAQSPGLTRQASKLPVGYAAKQASGYAQMHTSDEPVTEDEEEWALKIPANRYVSVLLSTEHLYWLPIDSNRCFCCLAGSDIVRCYGFQGCTVLRRTGLRCIPTGPASLSA